MITCIIIDDEKPARAFLEKLINQYLVVVTSFVKII
jgi:DNA-binding LytR/AlgR family response regulator